METVKEAIARRKSALSFMCKKVEVMDRFDATRIHYNKH